MDFQERCLPIALPQPRPDQLLSSHSFIPHLTSGGPFPGFTCTAPADSLQSEIAEVDLIWGSLELEVDLLFLMLEVAVEKLGLLLDLLELGWVGIV